MVLAGENEVLGRRLAVPAGRDLEGNLLPFVQRSKASPLDGADMDEYVSGAILRLDEPVTLGRVEPLDSTCSHYRFLSRQSGEAPPHAAPLRKRSQCQGRNLAARSRGQSVQQQGLGNAGRSIHAKSKRASAPHAITLAQEPGRCSCGRWAGGKGATGLRWRWKIGQVAKVYSTACDALAFEERLGLLVDRELTVRDDRRMTSRLRRAKLRHPNACIEDIGRMHRGLGACRARAGPGGGLRAGGDAKGRVSVGPVEDALRPPWRRSRASR